MSDTIIVAIITSVLALAGVIISGVLTSKANKKNLEEHSAVTLYRIDRLEEKQDKHNTLIERMYKVEDRLNVVDEKIKVANNRISDLENN